MSSEANNLAITLNEKSVSYNGNEEEKEVVAPQSESSEDSFHATPTSTPELHGSEDGEFSNVGKQTASNEEFIEGIEALLPEHMELKFPLATTAEFSDESRTWTLQSPRQLPNNDEQENDVEDKPIRRDLDGEYESELEKTKEKFEQLSEAIGSLIALSYVFIAFVVLASCVIFSMSWHNTLQIHQQLSILSVLRSLPNDNGTNYIPQDLELLETYRNGCAGVIQDRDDWEEAFHTAKRQLEIYEENQSGCFVALWFDKKGKEMLVAQLKKFEGSQERECWFLEPLKGKNMGVEFWFGGGWERNKMGVKIGRGDYRDLR
jgi:hypothetical protein